MAVGDKQKLITEIVGVVLNEKPQTDRKFDWFINKHTVDNFKSSFTVISNIFKDLNGDINANISKRTKSLKCDAYFGGKYNFIFEFDEFQHFSSHRLKTFEFYSESVKLNFCLQTWIKYCNIHHLRADGYRKSKTTTDFNLVGGRTAQRAYLDCFRDLLPHHHGLNPTLRISEFEVENIYFNNKASCLAIEKVINSKLKHL